MQEVGDRLRHQHLSLAAQCTCDRATSVIHTHLTQQALHNVIIEIREWITHRVMSRSLYTLKSKENKEAEFEDYFIWYIYILLLILNIILYSYYIFLHWDNCLQDKHILSHITTIMHSFWTKFIICCDLRKYNLKYNLSFNLIKTYSWNISRDSLKKRSYIHSFCF